MEVMECRPISDTLPINLSNEHAFEVSNVTDNISLLGGSRHSSSSDNITIYSTAHEHPAPQRMNSEIEMADIGLLRPGHLDSSAPNDTGPPPAMGTGTGMGGTPS